MAEGPRVYENVQLSGKAALGLMFTMALLTAAAAHMMTPTLQEGSVLRCYEVFDLPVVTRAIRVEPGEAQ